MILLLLEVVTNPVVVNGDKILLEKAQEKNWPKLQFKIIFKLKLFLRQTLCQDKQESRKQKQARK